MINIPYNTTHHKPSQMAMDQLRSLLENGRNHGTDYLEMFEQAIADTTTAIHAIYCSNSHLAYMLTIASVRHRNRFPAMETSCYNDKQHRLGYALAHVEHVIHHDIDPDTYLVPSQPTSLLNLYNPIDTFGNLWKGEPIIDPDLTIVDASHSLGMKGVGSRGAYEVCDLGEGGVFGWEGGLILTNNDQAVGWLRQERDRLCKPSEYMSLIAYDILKTHKAKLHQRAKVYEQYRSELHKVCNFQLVKTGHSHHVIAMRSRWTQKILNHSGGIEFKRLYMPLSALDNASKVYNDILCLPVEPDSVQPTIDAIKWAIRAP